MKEITAREISGIIHIYVKWKIDFKYSAAFSKNAIQRPNISKSIVCIHIEKMNIRHPIII